MILLILSAIIVLAEEKPDADAVVVQSSEFVLLQKDIDVYRSVIAPDNNPIDKKVLIEAIVQYELFSREYFKNHKDNSVVDLPDTSEAVKAKVMAAKKYIQIILDDYAVPDDVVTAYYRSYPEKFRAGIVSDVDSPLLPFTEELKKEIKFIIVEKKKNAIIENAVQNLTAKYDVRVNGK